MAHEEDELARVDLQGDVVKAGLLGCAGYTFVTWSNVMTGVPVCWGMSSTSSTGSDADSCDAVCRSRAPHGRRRAAQDAQEPLG